MNCTLILLLIQLVLFQNHTLPLTNNCNNRKPSSNFLDHFFFQAFIFRLWRWTELIVLKKMSRAFNAFSLGVWSTRFRAVFTASVFWCLSFLVYNMYHPRTGIDSVTESGSQSFRGRTLWLAVTFHVCLWQGLLWSLASSCLRSSGWPWTSKSSCLHLSKARIAGKCLPACFLQCLGESQPGLLAC